MQVHWEEDPGISPHGMLSYFLEFLHLGGLWAEFVEQCPLRYSSPNGPTKAEILGTIWCSVVSGPRRHAHITGMRSEDSIRRAFAQPGEVCSCRAEAAPGTWSSEQEDAQLRLPGCVLEHKGGEWYEHAVLVTSWEEQDLLAVAQAYHDRADSENMFDELQNQWGWTGFSTEHLKRSQLMALIFNWWSLFTRLAGQDKHGQAITTRPLFLHGIARHTRHAQQNHLSLSSLYAKARKIAHVLSGLSGWLRAFRDAAEQLISAARWPTLLRHIFRHFCSELHPSAPHSALVAGPNCRI